MGYRPQHVRHTDFDAASARRRTHELPALPEPPTAPLVRPDRMAPGVYDAPGERGPRIPHDVGAVGLDDLPESRRTAPPPTTVRQPVAEMAVTALRLLVRLMDGDRPENTRTELSTTPVERASAAAPRI
ncbi:substrate-binding domain-containing protein [Streptomyces sp. NPDC093094]|uniref:substrate-binding domain-containing protein n=1 Tax=Streptomyces sp. NPDC093094 TaxID=3366026 RepID=UPI00381052E1